jgi:hypothetical protein
MCNYICMVLRTADISSVVVVFVIGGTATASEVKSYQSLSQSNSAVYIMFWSFLSLQGSSNVSEVLRML